MNLYGNRTAPMPAANDASLYYWLGPALMNRQALTFTHNRDGEKLRLPERLLLAMCRPVEAPSLSVATVSYTLDNALEYATRMIPRFLERIQGKTVLDYGCGPGWQAVAMRRAGARDVHGVDINDEWLSHGRDLDRKSTRLNSSHLVIS